MTNDRRTAWRQYVCAVLTTDVAPESAMLTADSLLASEECRFGPAAEEAGLVEELRRECRAKEDDLIALERRLQELEAQLLDARTTLAGSAYRTTLRGLVESWSRVAACGLRAQECAAALRAICDVLDAAEEQAARGKVTADGAQDREE